MRERLGLIIGLTLFVAALLLPAPTGMPEPAWRTTAVAMLMATWWVTEAIPIPATALLPLVLFPLLGPLSMNDAASPYANPVIYLFMGGFLIAAALQKCGLHRRMALVIIRAGGVRPARLIGAFMLATAVLSMWVSNTATVAMMLPLALSIIAVVDTGATPEAPRDPHFGVALMLGLAYASSIGGLGTLIGTPPNALLAGFMSEAYGVTIGFREWMVLGVPLVIVALPIAWLVLTRFVYPVADREIAGGRQMIRTQVRELGAASRGEWTVGAVTALTAAAWVFRPQLAGIAPDLSDTGIAIGGAVLLFLLPIDREGHRALDWESAERLPWGVLVLFGGGLSLASAIQTSGLASWIGGALAFVNGWPLLAVVLVITAVVIFLTELTSNTATTAAFLPVVAALAIAIAVDPMLLTVPTAIAASCAFMMPVATPPNAIVYGSGQITISQMLRAGFVLNLILIVIVTLASVTLVPILF